MKKDIEGDDPKKQGKMKNGWKEKEEKEEKRKERKKKNDTTELQSDNKKSNKTVILVHLHPSLI